MLKLFGVVIVVLGCGMLGLIIAGNFAQRPQLLRQLQSGLQMLETEIIFASTPLPLALFKVGKRMDKPLQQLFLDTSSQLASNQGLTAGEAWNLCLEKHNRNLALDDAELSVLKSFGWCLGQSDKEEQIKNLRLTIEQLRQEEGKAEKNREKNQKLYTYLGFCFGITLAILLL